MLDHGVVVTLNTDDPPMFGATLEGEYLLVAQTLGLHSTEVAQLAKNAVNASFLNAMRKAAMLAEIDTITHTGERSRTTGDIVPRMAWSPKKGVTGSDVRARMPAVADVGYLIAECEYAVLCPTRGM